MLTKIIKVSLINWHSRVTPATDISFHLWKWTIYSLFEKCHEKQDSSNTCLPSARVLLLGLSSEYSTDIALIGTCIEAWLVLGESSWSDHVAYPGNERNRLLGPWYFAFCSEMASLLRICFQIPPSSQAGQSEGHTVSCVCFGAGPQHVDPDSDTVESTRSWWSLRTRLINDWRKGLW